MCYFSLGLFAALIVNPLGKKVAGWLSLHSLTTPWCSRGPSWVLGEERGNCALGVSTGFWPWTSAILYPWWYYLLIIYVNLVQYVHPVPFSIYSVLLFSSLSIVIYPLRVICHQVSGKKVWLSSPPWRSSLAWEEDITRGVLYWEENYLGIFYNSYNLGVFKKNFTPQHSWKLDPIHNGFRAIQMHKIVQQKVKFHYQLNI